MNTFSNLQRSFLAPVMFCFAVLASLWLSQEQSLSNSTELFLFWLSTGSIGIALNFVSLYALTSLYPDKKIENRTSLKYFFIYQITSFFMIMIASTDGDNLSLWLYFSAASKIGLIYFLITIFLKTSISKSSRSSTSTISFASIQAKENQSLLTLAKLESFLRETLKIIYGSFIPFMIIFEISGIFQSHYKAMGESLPTYAEWLSVLVFGLMVIRNFIRGFDDDLSFIFSVMLVFPIVSSLSFLFGLNNIASIQALMTLSAPFTFIMLLIRLIARRLNIPSQEELAH